jgi:ADP-ribosylglycohydrolase
MTGGVQSLFPTVNHELFMHDDINEPPFPLTRPALDGPAPDAGQLDRAQGCLLGQLVGDSLGSLVEFRSTESIREEYPRGIRELQNGGGTWNLLAGQPTDDSELALVLARTLIHRRRFDPDAVLTGYVYWYRSRPFDVGMTTSRALGSRLPNPHSQANGSLMRISPLGIFGARHPDRALQWARQDSSLTHPHPVCQDACAVLVLALARTIHEGCDARACLEAALAASNEEAVREKLQLASESPPVVFDDSRQGWVLIALQNAFYQALYAPDVEEGLVDTVMRGGDTDTNAAIAGALLGAIHGRRGVPERWQRDVLSCRPGFGGVESRHPRPQAFWPADALELAEDLLRACGGEDSASM